ncbi:MAG: type II secretion system protein GspM [Myxococcales bacterium]
MAFGEALDNVRSWIDSLSNRERRLLGIMGAVFLALLVLVPIYAGISSISDIESENDEIARVLQDIHRSEQRLLQQKAERRAVERLYNRKAPSLGGFLEERAQQYGVTGLSVTDQPKLDMGGYTRRSVRVSLPMVEIRPLIEMLADIENSSYPVAIEQIQMTGGRMRTGYTVKLAIDAYDRQSTPTTEEQ